MSTLYLTMIVFELQFELANFLNKSMRSPEKNLVPSSHFLHFEIFRLLRSSVVKNCMDCDISYNFSFELRCGIRTYLEAGRFCAVDYESFGT